MTTSWVESLLRRALRPSIPREIAERFRALGAQERVILAECIKDKYLTRQIWGPGVTSDDYVASDAGRKDLADQVQGRLDDFRSTIIPWLNAAKPLAGARILEIGCGSGSSTVALAEQGATVTAVDIDRPSLEVAVERCRLYGLNAEFHDANAMDVHRLFAGKRFDFLIFFACLEHTTLEERLASMRETWSMLSPGDVWCVIETPNRLWYFDYHTALLPFYSWLPDDLAFKYARHSPRKPFNAAYGEPTAEAMLSFLRHGRGVSYHEFDLALGDVKTLRVLSSLQGFEMDQNLLRRLRNRMGMAHRFESFLTAVGPAIHRGFYESRLDLIIQKT
jgi:S-adenosylmethionine-dependent methyltransferase